MGTKEAPPKVGGGSLRAQGHGGMVDEGREEGTAAMLRDQHTGVQAVSMGGGGEGAVFSTKAGPGELGSLFYLNSPQGSLSQHKAGGSQPRCQLRTTDRGCVLRGQRPHLDRAAL